MKASLLIRVCFLSRVAAVGVAALLVAMTTGTAFAADFVKGDLWLISPALGNPVRGGPGLTGVMRIDPSGGTTLFSLPNTFMTGRGTYDPFRERLVVMRSTGNPFFIDADGVATFPTLSWDQPFLELAPRGDGLIYIIGTSKFGYLDSSNVSHNVLNFDGSAPMLHNSGSPGSSCLFYHAPTNALFMADPDGAGATRVRKYTLTASGTQVVGPVANHTFNASTAGHEDPVGFSHMTDGNILLKVDDKSGSLQPRMLKINSADGTISVYASSEYFGVGGETTGAFSTQLGLAVVLDTVNNKLRLYAPGETGGGLDFVVGKVSAEGTGGEQARLVEIGGTVGSGPPCPSDLTPPGGNGEVDVDDLLGLINAWGPCVDCPEDLTGDDVVDVDDLLMLINAWGPCP